MTLQLSLLRLCAWWWGW